MQEGLKLQEAPKELSPIYRRESLLNQGTPADGNNIYPHMSTAFAAVGQAVHGGTSFQVGPWLGNDSPKKHTSLSLSLVREKDTHTGIRR